MVLKCSGLPLQQREAGDSQWTWIVWVSKSFINSPQNSEDLKETAVHFKSHPLHPAAKQVISYHILESYQIYIQKTFHGSKTKQFSNIKITKPSPITRKFELTCF
jgi:hypothetical protein